MDKGPGRGRGWKVPLALPPVLQKCSYSGDPESSLLLRFTMSFSILSKPRGPRARTHHTQDHAPKPPVPLQRGSATRPSSSHCIRAIRACIPPLNTRELLLLWCRDKGRTASGHRPYQQRPWLPLTQLPPVLWSVQLHETHDGPQRLSCTLPRNRTQIPEF